MADVPELVEKVARAIWAERVRHTAEAHPGIRLEPYDTDWGGKPVAEQNNILGEARAAIEAMMEPNSSAWRLKKRLEEDTKRGVDEYEAYLRALVAGDVEPTILETIESEVRTSLSKGGE